MPPFSLNMHVIINGLLLLVIALLYALNTLGVPVGGLIATVAAAAATYNGWIHSLH